MKPMMSAGAEELEGGSVVKALVACDPELEEDDITLLVSRLCPKSYTWPFFGSPTATIHTSGSNFGSCIPSSAYFSLICQLYDSYKLNHFNW